MGTCASKKSADENTALSLSVKPITIETETWKRDSHGLFDYETSDVVKKTLRVVGSTQLYRDNDHLEQTANKYNSRRADVMLDVSFESRQHTISERDEMEEDKFQHPNYESLQRMSSDHAEFQKSQSKDKLHTPVAHIVYKHGQYWIYNKPYYNKDDDFISNPENLVWFTIRDYRDSASSFGYKLSDGDILKFGRARLKVVKFHFDTSFSKSTESRIRMSEKLEQLDSEPIDTLKDDFETEGGSEKNTCRICFVEAEPSNPLISVCKCSGSMKHIHQECLKGWIDSKKVVKATNESVTYHWKSFE